MRTVNLFIRVDPAIHDGDIVNIRQGRAWRVNLTIRRRRLEHCRARACARSQPGRIFLDKSIKPSLDVPVETMNPLDAETHFSVLACV